MDNIDDFLRVAESQGVHLDGIEPVKIPGRGIGITATRALKPGEAILDVPMQAVRSLHAISKSVLQQLPVGLSFHGILAADLALDTTAAFASWKKLLPSQTDFPESMPFTWPEELRNLLPKGASDIVQKQHVKFEQQWGAAAKAFPSLTRDEYMYFWLLVNTRTFYLETPELEAFPWDDRLALLPIADLFNHADQGCHVAYGADGYTITANRRYERGDEVFASYGDHPNDLLLAEYGFVMSENKWDAVCLDEVVMPKLTPAQKQELDSNGHGGPYMLAASTGPSRQLAAVLRLLTSSGASSRASSADEDQRLVLDVNATKLLKTILSESLEKAQEMRAKVHELQVGNAAQRDTLSQRWEQIEDLLSQEIVRLH
ncbi:set domain protein [Apiospora arundinis]